ncbi:S1 family peptidase [Rhizosphaericola mali]|uniref:Trypsin-like peptidase domain-containing protein n=1 Tax=Rhizosphaericola mali TaxID=2545455 RepID=A0A5P2GBS6_9BACT|nr:serine protease [Rhizosphaericola mali]QES89021.1 trypsin-like peptidase domain-containing protein [Rhizosphaericola mali]
MKFAFLIFLSSIVCQIGRSQFYSDLDKDFKTDSFYIKDLDMKLSNAIHHDANAPLYLQDLQEKFSKLKMVQSLKLDLVSAKNVKDASKNLFEERKNAVWIVSKLFNSKYDTAKIVVPIATAYSIDKSGICVSNFHVFSEVFFPMRSRITQKIQQDSSLFFLQNIDGDIYFIDSILAYDPINDITVFHIRSKSADLPFIPIAKEYTIGEKVYLISHPDNNFYYLSNGIINRKYRDYVNYRIDGPYPKYIMDVSADYAIGSSGGPIMNEKGELVGMVSSTHVISTNPGTQYQQQMVLKRSVPLEVIRKLLF